MGERWESKTRKTVSAGDRDNMGTDPGLSNSVRRLALDTGEDHALDKVTLGEKKDKDNGQHDHQRGRHHQIPSVPCPCWS